MVSTSKILTVSYGTFSCTLEGFDDSFETMKAIAEYFRDLAADDRYFGAEPPTPDAEMLARIAEREIARRVEAHEEHGKIHLRADDGLAAAEAVTHAAPLAAPEEQETAVEAPQVERAPEVETETNEADAPVSQDDVETPVSQDDEVEAAPETDADDAETLEDEVTLVPDAAPAVADVHTLVEEQPAVDEAQDTDAAGESEISASVAEDQSETAADEIAAVAEDEAPESEVAEESPVEGDEAVEEVAKDEAIEDGATTSEQERIDEGEVIVNADVSAFLADAEADEADAEAAFDQQVEDASVAEDDVEAVTTPADDAEADSVAEKLRRIRSVVSQSDLDYDVSEYSEDEHAQDVAASPAEELDALLSAYDDEIVEEMPETADADTAPEIPEVGEDTLESVMAELEAEADVDDIDTDEEPVDAMDTDAGEDHEAPVAGIPVDEDTLSQLLADAAPIVAEDEAGVPEIAEDLDVDDADVEDDGDAPESLFADLDDVLDTETGSAIAEPSAPLVLGEEARVAEDPEPKEVRPLNARVLKMKRADFEEAISQGVIEEERDADDEALLSPEEEADLQAELAAVEAELAGNAASDLPDEADEQDEMAEAAALDDALFDDEDDLTEASDLDVEDEKTAELIGDDVSAEAEAGENVAEGQPRRGFARLLGMGKRATEDEERIFEEADSQMGDKDASMRRTAIQHLRAAVAATKAEKSAGVDVDPRVDETPYRSDLAEVVRPRRPSAPAPTTRSERPSDQRPAPLKLVAEQRVDQERAPVRPRRVATVKAPVEQSSDGGFTEFAEKMGATNLSELLEAAAAYMSDVEGHSEFTRPMLMGKLKEVKSDSYSREDGLRSFGQLLREGKLRKLKGGRFSATDETEFRAETRNAG